MAGRREDPRCRTGEGGVHIAAPWRLGEGRCGSTGGSSVQDGKGGGGPHCDSVGAYLCDDMDRPPAKKEKTDAQKVSELVGELSVKVGH